MGIREYILQKLLIYLLVLWIGITITFFLPRFMPSDPIENYIAQIQTQAGQSLSVEAIEELRHNLARLYGLEGSLLSQYVSFLKRVFVEFDFGPSLSSFPRPVSAFIFEALPWTLGLLGVSTIISWLLGNLVGLIAGYFHGTRETTVLEVVGILLYPIPYYVLALVLILLFAYIWPIFPLSTTIRPGPMTLEKMQAIIRSSILPAMTIILAGFGWNVLGMEALAYSTREEPFVRFARLKRVPTDEIMMHYVLRNAILPQVTSLALSLGRIFSGALLTEMLFSYPGLGFLMRTAIGNGDYNMLYGTLTMSIIAVATAALVIDLVYPLLDPRIRYR